jgi:Icc-related predicted phosphoesterase
MRVGVISDTHGQHYQIHEHLVNEELDILIHAGDGTNHKNPIRNENELRNVLTWMDSLEKSKHKIYIPGNHDTSFENGLVKPEEYPNIIFLIDDWIQIWDETTGDDVIIHGSPYTPTFGHKWAYNAERGAKIKKHWDQIYEFTDILVTHGPPKYILDHTAVGYGSNVESVGCKDLLNAVLKIQPKYHIFGHLHDEEGVFNHGIKKLGDKCPTTFVNVSIVNLRHNVVNKPIFFQV